MDAYTFAMQQRTFDVHGYAVNPSSMSNQTPIVGSLSQAHENGYLAVDAMRPSRALQKATKRKRKGKGDASVVDGDDAYMGPWAAYEVEQCKQIEVDDAEDGAEEWRAEKKRREEAQETAREAMKTAREEKTIFHGEYCKVNDGGGLCSGKELHDYAGRTYMHIPTDLDVKLNPSEGSIPPNSYLPDKCIHTWVSDAIGPG
jgi:pre-mRNA-processing factor 17